MYQGTVIILSADFSIEALQAIKKWHDVFKVMKWENLQPSIFYLVRLSFRFGDLKFYTQA